MVCLKVIYAFSTENKTMYSDSGPMLKSEKRGKATAE